MKLNFKITLLSGATMFFILVASLTGIYFLYEKFAYNTEYQQLQTRADEFASVVSNLQSTAGIDNIARAYIPVNGALRISDKSKKNLLHLQSVSTDEKITFPKLNQYENYVLFDIDEVPALAIEYPIIWPTTHEVVQLQLVQTLPDIQMNMALLRWIFIIMTLIAIVPIYLASIWLSRIITKPINKLTTTMKTNIENASYAIIENPGRSKDELAQMTHTYNELMKQLQSHYERQQQFVGNASHELKTPLTVIESYIQLLQRRGIQNEAITKEAIDAIAQQSRSMKEMIKQMLQLASAQETTQMTWQTIDLSKLLQEISSSMQQAYSRKVTIHGDTLSLISDELKLKQLLYIFIDNARKYSEEPIDIHVIAKNEFIKIDIQDKGIGIDKEEIPHLFERFYRVNKDRNRKTGGTGLGLAIAKELATHLHAQIQYESELGKGTSVHITLPKDGGSYAKK